MSRRPRARWRLRPRSQLVTAAFFGLLPALGASRTDAQRGLKLEGIRRRWQAEHHGDERWWPRRLPCSSSCSRRPACLCGHLQKLRSVDAGFHQEQVLVVKVSTGPAFPENSSACALRRALRAVQRVARRAVGQHVHGHPAVGELSMCAGHCRTRPSGGPRRRAAVCHNFVGPRFFETLGIPVLAGRDFEPGDDERAPSTS